MNCTKCGANIDPGTRSCVQCGSPALEDINEYFDGRWRNFAKSPLMIVALVLSVLSIIFYVSGFLIGIPGVVFSIGLLLIIVQAGNNKPIQRVNGLVWLIVGMVLFVLCGGGWLWIVVFGSIVPFIIRIKKDVEQKDVRTVSMVVPAVELFVAAAIDLIFALGAKALFAYLEIDVSNFVQINIIGHVVLSALLVICGIILLMYGKMKQEMQVWYENYNKKLKEIELEAQKNEQTVEQSEAALDVNSPEFQNLPAWKKVELMKQQNQEQ